MISDLSERIEIKRLAEGEDFGFEGGSTPSESSILSTWAAIKEVSRRDPVKQEMGIDTVLYDVVIRYNTGRNIKQGDVVIWNNARHTVKTSPSVIEIKRKRFLKFLIVRENG